MLIKKIVLTIGLTLCISQSAFASEIDCGKLKAMATKVASIDCSNNTKTLVKPAEVNVKEPSVAYKQGGSQNIIRTVQSLSKDIQELINWAANKVGVSAKLLGAIADAESSGNQAARSSAGAIGIMQLMPGTAKSLGVNPHDTKENVLGGAMYIKQQIDKYQGSIPKALAAYNAGPGAVDKYGGVPPYRETKSYVQSIMASLR